MTSSRIVIGAELVGAFLAVLAGVWSWDRGVRTSDFGPALEGAPTFVGTDYSGSWITLAFALIGVAGSVTIDAVRRWVRDPKHRAQGT